MHVPFLDLRKQNARYLSKFQEAIAMVATSATTILGPEVRRFETRWAKFCDRAHCVGVGNGYDAMRIMLRAYGIGPGDEVLVASNTHIATWLAVLAEGAKIVVAEPNPDTMVLGRWEVENVITKKTKAILATPLYGIPIYASALRCAAPGIPILLDAAQAHGIAGDSVADAAAFSFYPTKNLGALGDGGAVVCDDATIADKMYHLRSYGARYQNQHEVIGVNSRLDELQAVILNIKLSDLSEGNARRKDIADHYHARLANTRLKLPPKYGFYHQFVIRYKDRDGLRLRLKEHGIETLIHYPTPPHLQPAMKKLGYTKGSFPLAEQLSDHCLSLPIGPELDDGQVIYVANVLRQLV